MAATAGCPPPARPEIALRLGLEGDSAVSYDIDESGHVARAVIDTSTGWPILDHAHLDSLTQCRFSDQEIAAASARRQRLTHSWRIAPPLNRPRVVPRGCTPTDEFTDFISLDRHPTDAQGILVAFTVDQGRLGGDLDFSTHGYPADAPMRAIAFLRTCGFATDAARAGTHTNATYGRVLVNQRRGLYQPARD